MSVPTTKVEIAFDLSAVDPDFFTLDDPVRGELDNATYLLAGDILQDVTDKVRRVSISRGRSRELDRYSTGQATVVLDNRDRDFDPTNTASPFAGQILPRKAVQISVDGFPAIVGNVQDWGFTYELSGDATSSVSVVDGFAILSRQSVDNIAVVEESSDDRVNAILTQVAWPTARRNVEPGVTTLAAGTATSNALTYLQEIETCEAGDFFISQSGLATFKARQSVTSSGYDDAVGYDADIGYTSALPTVTSDLIFTDEADDGTSRFVPYVSLGLELGTDLLFNQADLTLGSATITAQDAASQTTYGAAVLSSNVSLLSTTAQGTALAEYLVAKYAQPVTRLTDISVELAGLPTGILSKLLTLDLGDVVKVRFQPNGIGDRVERRSIVEGINHEIGLDRHRILFKFSGAPGS